MDRLNGVQFLRFVAALMVVTAHALQGIHLHSTELGFPDLRMNSFYATQDAGALGADIFFLISGLIIGLVVKSPLYKGVEGANLFLRKRFLRIVPLYWLCTILYALFLYFIVDGGFNLEQLLFSLLFIPYEGHQTLFVGWSLNFEMLFYLIVFLVMFLPRALMNFVIPILFLILVSIGSFYDFSSYTLNMWSSSLVLEFVGGFILSVFYLKYQHKMRAIPKAFWFLCLGLVCVWFGFIVVYGFAQVPIPRFIWFGVPSGLLLLSVLGLEESFKKGALACFSRLGDSSYSLYLVHTFVIYACIHTWSWLELGVYLPTEVCLLIILVLSVYVGKASYKYMEKPLIRRFSRRPLLKVKAIS